MVSMTEADWKTCADPDRMLDYLLGRDRPSGNRLLALFGFRGPAVEDGARSISERKLRLFAVACCDRIWSLLRDERSRQAVQTSSQYAQGKASAEELTTAWAAGRAAVHAGNPAFYDESRSAAAGYVLITGKSQLFAAQAAAEAASSEIADVIHTVSDVERAVLEAATTPDRARAWADQIGAAVRADLLRDLFGNPFRPSPSLPPSLLAWHEGTIRRLAQAIFDKGTFENLPILADALLDGGCEDEDLVAHCRCAGPHVPGCWAVDLILGLE